jgi:hypothetical protein
LLRKFLREKAPIRERIRYYVTCGNFEKAFKYFRTVSGGQNRWDTFLNGLFEPALQSNFLTRLFHRMREQVPLFGPLCEKLLSTAQRLQMLALLYEVQLLLDRRADAADTASRLLLACETPDAALRVIAKGLAAAAACPGDTQAVKIAQMQLQKRFCEFCRATNRRVWRELDLFSNPAKTETIVAGLFRNYQCELGIDILKQCGLSVRKIAEKVADILVNDSDEKMREFIRVFESQASPAIFRGIVHHAIARLRDVHELGDELAVLVRTEVRDPEFRCLALVELGAVEEAFAVARKEGLTGAIQAIASIAARMGRTAILADAQKELVRAAVA